MALAIPVSIVAGIIAFILVFVYFRNLAGIGKKNALFGSIAIGISINSLLLFITIFINDYNSTIFYKLKEVERFTRLPVFLIKNPLNQNVIIIIAILLELIFIVLIIGIIIILRKPVVIVSPKDTRHHIFEYRNIIDNLNQVE